MLPARTVKWATGVFYGPREHPNIFQGTGQHWLIFQENKGINLIFGDRKVAIWKTHPFLCIVRLQSQCFDALLIFKRMLISENWLKQDIRILQFMHRICGTFCVRRYQQFCTLMVNGNAYNQNSLIAVTQWVEKTDLIRSAVWSYSTVHAEKVWLALAMPLWNQLSHFIAETPRGPHSCFNCLS